jgi:hypothetical protein
MASKTGARKFVGPGAGAGTLHLRRLVRGHVSADVTLTLNVAILLLMQVWDSLWVSVLGWALGPLGFRLESERVSGLVSAWGGVSCWCSKL